MTQRAPGKANAWKFFSARRGLRLVSPSALLVHERSHVIEGIVDDVALVIDTCMESSRDRFVMHTRVTGRAVAPVPVRLAVQSRSGRADVAHDALPSLDDRAFDERFAVRSSPAEPVRKLLGEEVRRALLRFPDLLVLTYDEGEARLFWEGVESEVDTLDLAADVVLAACRFRGAAGYR